MQEVVANFSFKRKKFN